MVVLCWGDVFRGSGGTCKSMASAGLLGKGNLRSLVFDANHDTHYAQTMHPFDRIIADGILITVVIVP